MDGTSIRCQASTSQGPMLAWNQVPPQAPDRNIEGKGAKWRFQGNSLLKDGIILVVTGILGGGSSNRDNVDNTKNPQHSYSRSKISDCYLLPLQSVDTTLPCLINRSVDKSGIYCLRAWGWWNMLPYHLLLENSIESKDFPEPSTKQLLYRLYRFHSGTLQQILRAHTIWWITQKWRYERTL